MNSGLDAFVKFAAELLIILLSTYFKYYVMHRKLYFKY